MSENRSLCQMVSSMTYILQGTLINFDHFWGVNLDFLCYFHTRISAVMLGKTLPKSNGMELILFFEIARIQIWIACNDDDCIVGFEYSIMMMVMTILL